MVSRKQQRELPTLGVKEVKVEENSCYLEEEKEDRQFFTTEPAKKSISSFQGRKQK